MKHRFPAYNLLQRLKTFQTETLRFLTDFDVPFTDHLAEQDLGVIKVKIENLGLIPDRRPIALEEGLDFSGRERRRARFVRRQFAALDHVARRADAASA